jgi:hypothetical protein
MNKPVKNYTTFINENLLKRTGEKLKKGITKAKKYITEIFKSMEDFFISVFTPKRISKGLKKGTSDVVYFNASKGSILDQIESYYSKTEYGQTNSMSSKPSKEKSIDEAKLGLEFPQTGRVQNVGVEELKDHIREQWIGSQEGYAVKPTFIYGAPGIGKTQIVAAMADEFKCDMTLIDVQNKDVSDFTGLPVPNAEGDAVKFIKGEDFPRDPNSKGILFLDELPNADMYVLKKLNQFIQQKRLDNYYMPKGWIIIVAGNRPGDHSDITDLGDNPTLAERFSPVNFVPTLEDWIKWAKERNEDIKAGNDRKKDGEKKTYILPEIISFLKNAPEYFYNLDPDVNPHSYASSRGWENAAKGMQITMKMNNVTDWKDIPIEKYRRRLTTAVGFEAAQVFLEYLEIFSKMTEREAKQIIEEPEKAKMFGDLKQNPGKFFGLSEYLTNRVNEIKNDLEKLDAVLNVVKYLIRYETYEYVVAAFAKLQKEDPKLLSFVGAEKKSDKEKEKLLELKDLITEIKNKKR